MTGPSLRHAVAECSPAVRTLTDLELRAFGCAILAELARRDGATVAASWAAVQAERLRSLDGATG